MKNKQSIVSILLLSYTFSQVFAEDHYSSIEKEMLPAPPGVGQATDEVKIYSRIRNNTIDKEIVSQFENNAAKVIVEPEKYEHKPYLKLDKEGIEVYIFSHKKSPFATFKAITHINATLDSILAVMLDNKACVEWIDSCKNSFLIKSISFNERYHYQIFSIPIPFQNRDFIFHSTMKQNPASKTVTITMLSVPNYCKDKQSAPCQEVNRSDLVRVNKSIGTFKLEAKDNGTTITWIQHTDPAGNLPGWLVNQFMKNTPFLTFKSLAHIVKQEPYKFARLIYDSKGMAMALEIPARNPEKSAGSENNFVLFPTF